MTEKTYQEDFFYADGGQFYGRAIVKTRERNDNYKLVIAISQNHQGFEVRREVFKTSNKAYLQEMADFFAVGDKMTPESYIESLIDEAYIGAMKNKQGEVYGRVYNVSLDTFIKADLEKTATSVYDQVEFMTEDQYKATFCFNG